MLPPTTRAARAWGLAAAALVLLHVGLRGWLVQGAWFYVDDHTLLIDAQRRAGSVWEYLVTPHDSQLMPGGRLEALLVLGGQTPSWATAAALTVATSLLASLACLWMLVAWFGRRPAVLALFALWSTTAITTPAATWWAAALNQLPLQLVGFVSLALAAGYFRRPSWRSAAMVCLAVVVGLLFYVKTVLLPLVLAALAVGWFARGGPRARIVTVVRRYRHAVLIGGTALGLYSAWYLLGVPSLVSGTGDAATAGDVLRQMLGTTVPVVVLGGPWSWWDAAPQVVFADPPAWARAAARVLVGLLLVLTVLTRRRAGRAWALLAGYAVALYLMLLVTRAQVAGGLAGLELRYVTDLAIVLPLAVGLALLPVAGAVEHSEPRRGLPPRASALAPALGVLLLVVVCLGGVASSVGYGTLWHRDNASREWLDRARESLALAPDDSPVDLAERLVPPEVMPRLSAPDDQASRLVPLHVPGVRFPSVSDDLHALSDEGAVTPAAISPLATSQGRVSPECAVLVAGDSSTEAGRGSGRIDLQAVPGTRPPDDPRTYPWLRIGYLASQGSAAEVAVTDAFGTERSVDVRVRDGLHALFVAAPADTVAVELRGLGQGTSLCLDDVVLGVPQAVP